MPSPLNNPEGPFVEQLGQEAFATLVARRFGQGAGESLARVAYPFFDERPYAVIHGDLAVAGDLYLDSSYPGDSGQAASTGRRRTSHLYDSEFDYFGTMHLAGDWTPERYYSGILVDGSLAVAGRVSNTDRKWGVTLAVTGVLEATGISCTSATVFARVANLSRELACLPGSGETQIGELRADALVVKDHFTDVESMAVKLAWADRTFATRDSFLGFDSAGPNEALEYLSAQGYSQELIKAAGLDLGKGGMLSSLKLWLRAKMRGDWND